MKSFINFTNHKYELWSDTQKKEALKYGKVVDFPFPAVPSLADEKEVSQLAKKCVNSVLAQDPAAVLCQGEHSLCREVTNLLIKKRIPVLCACSERRVVERVTDSGTEKTTIFEFVRFRKYKE